MQTATKKTAFKTAIVNTKNGMALEVASEVKGSQILKIKRELTALQLSKKSLKVSVTEKRNSLTYNLNLIKDDCKNESSAYIQELSAKYSIKVSAKELFLLLSSPKNFIPYLTDSQLIKYNEKRLSFTPSLIIEAISKYFKAVYRSQK
jgi:hypothetical protein